jgi:hypothetical protein
MPPRVRTSAEGTPVLPDTGDANDRPELGFFGGAFAILFWLAVAFAVAQGNKTSREWLAHNWIWLSLLGGACLAIATLAVSRGWLQKRSAPLRAAIFLLVGMPLIALGAASVFFWMPTQDQLITLRAVVLVVLVVTPALMWWLFLANQRASLLNEFLANLQRLGLLERTVAGDRTESDDARATRVSSYLQRFEATYGRLPARIHTDVLANRFHPYSSEQARDQAPLATAAVPVSLAVVVLAIGWLIALPPIDEFPADDLTTPRWLLALSPNATPATFAFLGAYFFSMQMLFRRYVRADLRGSAYVAVVLRVLLAVIGAWVVSTVGKQAGWTEQSQLLTLSFVIGVFPMVTWQVIRGAASKVFKLALPSLESRLPLVRLDGLTVWHETRLEEEDIENVQNMATADIVDLLVNTRIPATRIIDWVDQAILLNQLGPDASDNADETSGRRRLARHGVRTASALLKTAADKTGGAQEEAFSRVLVDVDGNPAIPSIVSAIQTNSNLARILRWRGFEALLS